MTDDKDHVTDLRVAVARLEEQVATMRKAFEGKAGREWTIINWPWPHGNNHCKKFGVVLMKTLLTGAFVCLAIIAGWLEVTQPGTIQKTIPEYYFHR